MKANNNTFTTKINEKQANKLKKDLENQGFEITKPKYTLFTAKKKHLTCTVYQSLSLVVQGKDKQEFIEFYLEPEVLKTFTFTHPELGVSFDDRIGVDEAGKGDFFGPLCICALYADEKKIKELLKLNIKDSKKLSDSSIAKIAKNLMENFTYSSVKIFPQKYNDLYLKFKNLNTLLAWAHATAIENLVKKTNCTNVIIDQFANKAVVERAVKQKKLSINLNQKHKAEEDIVVAAASILARHFFLKGLEELSSEYDTNLKKGASNQVIELGKALVQKHGPNILEKIAKIHFKTKDDILNHD